MQKIQICTYGVDWTMICAKRFAPFSATRDGRYGVNGAPYCFTEPKKATDIISRLADASCLVIRHSHQLGVLDVHIPIGRVLHRILCRFVSDIQPFLQC